VLPAVTLSLPFAAYIARLTRIGMIEALSSDYMRTARAKGASETRGPAPPRPAQRVPARAELPGPRDRVRDDRLVRRREGLQRPGDRAALRRAVQNKDLFLIMGVVLIFAGMLVCST
jgi:oligopeptide transport system permease protein